MAVIKPGTVLVFLCIIAFIVVNTEKMTDADESNFSCSRGLIRELLFCVSLLQIVVIYKNILLYVVLFGIIEFLL